MRDSKAHTKRKGTQIATWAHPTDPTAYFSAEFYVETARKYVAELNEAGIKDDKLRKVTFNHVMVKAIAWGAWKQRRDWGRIVFGFFRPCKELGITVLCDADGKDLVPVTIWNAHEMTLQEIAEYLNGKVLNAKTLKDKEFNDSTKLFGIVPTFMLTPIMHCISYTAANLGFDLPGFGKNTKKFGHAVVTNVGTVGME